MTHQANHTNRSYVLSGTILSTAAGTPVPGLRVEVWDKGRRWLNTLDCAVTDSRGRFRVGLSDAYRERLFPDGPVELYLLIFDGGRVVASTLDTFVWAAETPSTDVLLRVGRDPVISQMPSMFVVRGRVEDASTGPVSGLRVQAFDRNPAPEGHIWRDDLLAEALTDERGWYEIQYQPTSITRRGKLKADLLVRVFSTSSPGSPVMLAESVVQCQAETIAGVDVAIGGRAYAGPSEVEDLDARVTSALDDGDLRLVDAREEHFGYLARTAGVDEANLRLLHRASITAQAASLPVHAMYGLARMGLPIDLRLLVTHRAGGVQGALERAIAQNVVPLALGNDLDALVPRIRDAIVDAIIAAGPAPETGALGAVLATSLASPETRRSFLAHYIDFDGPAEPFWAHLATLPGFEGNGAVEDLKLTLRIALLTHNNLPLMERIHALRSSGVVGALGDLTALSADDWHGMIEAGEDPVTGELPVPPHFAGATSTERASSYVTAILKTLGELFPTRYAARQMAAPPAIDMNLVRSILAANPGLDPSEPLPADAAGISDWQAARTSWEALRREIRAFPGFDHATLIASTQPFANPVRDGVASFLQAAPELEIRTTPIDAYVAANPGAFGGVPADVRSAAVSHLKAMQRVFQVAPLAEHVTGLLGAGLDSARRIARTPRGLFVEQFGSLLGGPDAANRIYLEAVRHAGAVQSSNTALRQATTDILPYVIRGEATAPLEPNPPDVAALFGSLSLCDCQHCRSVYSPAAYLVDLLHGLDPEGWNVVDANAHPVKKPADVLFSRRSDLQHIALTCENTNTPIPYIDLVNEVLESYVHARAVEQGAPRITIQARDTGTATAAELRAVPQYVLDSAYDELRAAIYPPALPYHRPLDVARVYLTHLGTSRLEVMKTFAPGGAPNDNPLVAEQLLLSEEEYRIIAGLDLEPHRRLEEFYGYPAQTASYLSDIARAPEMLSRTGLRYAELVELVQTWFVNRNQAVIADRITLASSTTDCDIANTTLTNLDVTALDRLHRFLRLQRRLGWSAADLDRALFAIGATDLDPVALRKLAQIKRLAADLARPVVQMLSLWSPIDTWNDDALYLDLFQNRAVARLDELADFALHYPFTEGTPPVPAPGVKSAEQLPELDAPGVLLGDHVPTLLAALGVTAPDLDALLTSANLSVSSPLDVASLSALYRRSLLARALGLRVPELATLLELVSSGADPFSGHDPGGAVAFVQAVRQVQRSGFDVPLLDYLYRDRAEAVGSPAPTHDRIAAAVQAVQTALIELAKETTASTGDEGSRGTITERLAQDLDLPASLIKTLLETQLASSLAQGDMAMDDFLALGAADLTEATRGKIEETYRLLHKASLLLRGFDLTERELAYISAHRADFDGFDLNALVPSPTDPRGAFRAWGRVANLVALRDSLPNAEKTLVDLFELPDGMTDGPAMLAKVTGWDEGLVTQIVGVTGLGFQEADYHREERLLALRDCVLLSRRIGISPDKLFAWSAQSVDAAQARDIVQTAKARHEDGAWLDIARKLNDTLRERQRSALVAYLLPRMRAQGIETDDDLYQYFLIDVDMGACMETSRIKQAISSVQLFVQRCLLNLESAVSPAHIDSEKWKWLKSYRVWEANRKVFLYPENWIEPELRADKSPFFRELETELLQADLTDQTAEVALTGYIEKLDDTAHLEPCGMYWQEELGAEPVDVLHVFARTPAEPRHYYYRRLVDRREWTAWERVELDIQGDHLIPVVHNRRLYLFWPVFSTVPDAKQPTSKEGETVKPATHVDISLVWSEYRQGKWLAKRTSSKKLYSPKEPPSSTEPLAHVFRAVVENGELSIRVRRHGDGGGVTEPIGSFSMDDRTVGVHESELVSPAEGFAKLYPSFPSGMVFEATEIISPTPDWTDVIYQGYGLNFLSPADSLKAVTVLDGVPEAYRLLYPHQLEDVSRPTSFGPTFYPFFFQDRRRVYFARPVVDTYTQKPGAMPGIEVPEPAALVIGGSILTPKPSAIGAFSTYEPSYPTLVGAVSSFASKSPGSLDSIFADTSKVIGFERIAFSSFYHPHTSSFIKAVRRDGVPGVLTLASQQRTNDAPNAGDLFASLYHPTWLVHSPGPTEDVTFEPGDAYALYNWELFFHAPLLVATQLSANQRYEDAQRWFHYIFDPTTHSKEPAPQRFWKVRPFHDNGDHARAQELMALLSYTGTDEAMLARKQKVGEQVAEWAAHPFDPHRIARLRVVAYQKSVVMKYVDNLIAWADQLFSRDTIESINEATQLYVLAANLLGPRPERVSSTGSAAPLTYADMRGKLDDFSDMAVALENVVFPFSIDAPPVGSDGAESILAAGDTLYFCTPQNDKLLGYWDKVADRLFKIRNCMNIEGIARTLPLFEPPIDPALLVRATAAGVDLGSVLADLTAPLPYYRFGVILQKALELAGELKSFGAGLLSAIEKKDGEELSARRASHESSLLQAVRHVREQQIEEAERALEGLLKTRDVTNERYQFYATIAHRILVEREQLDRLREAQTFQEGANFTEVMVANAAQLPNATLGTSGTFGSPVATTTFGATNAIAALQSASKILMWKAGYESYKANLASIKGGWARRSDDWKLQERLAKKELTQIDKQIEAARIRIEIARAELDNNALQIEQAAAIEELLRDKYTSQELYGWMVTQVSALYFQAYKMAYDMAKRAERAFRFERGLSPSTSPSYIQFGYWDNLKSGLLAGERLSLDLKRLDAAYLDQNRREYEITKNISLALHDPASLLALKKLGWCEVELPEELFDADYPGHYFRRIKSVSLTLPCVTGPYTSVNCTLTLLGSRVRVKSTPSSPYVEQPTNDGRFVDDFTAQQSVATSHGQSDAGVFELSFRDERYLPFEGAGAISRFRIELPQDANAFDFNTLSDVVLKMSYTAREDGSLRQAARASLDARRAALLPTEGALAPPLQRMVSARDELTLAWNRFLSAPAGSTRTLEFALSKDHFSYLFRSKNIQVTQVDLHIATVDVIAPPTGVTVKAPGGVTVPCGVPLSSAVPAIGGNWTIEASAPPANTVDLFIVLTYAVANVGP